jgi:ribosomal protein S18 acetylase RimI-like enzyme
MNIQLRAATASDLRLLLPYMQGYYSEDGLAFGEANAQAMARLLASPQYGCVWFIETDGQSIGYIVLCFGYSVELGGREAYIDELYVHPEQRGRGTAKAALALVLEVARAQYIRAVHLEVDMSNEAALRLYGALGFEVRDRYHFMTKPLRAPDPDPQSDHPHAPARSTGAAT